MPGPVAITPQIVPIVAASAPISDYTFWINISLVCATVVVTCVGVAVGIGAIVGYQAAKKMILRRSTKMAKEGVDAYLKSDEFKFLLNSQMKILVNNDMMKRFVLLLADQEPMGPSQGPTPAKED